MSKLQQSFGDNVLALKLRCFHGQLSLFPIIMVTISSPTVLRAFLLMMSKADKLPLEMKPVASDNSTI